MMLATLRQTIPYFFVGLLAATPIFAEEAGLPLQPSSTYEKGGASREEISPSPEVILKNGIAALTAQFKRGGNQQEMLDFLNKEIAHHFDFRYMAQLSAGYYWNSLSQEQQSVFMKYFQGTFFQALAQQISNLGNPQIQFYPARPGTNPNEITLSARVTQPQGLPILMDFRFYRGDQGWKVFDVVADGSSAVLYYRRLYANLVSRYGINTLLGSTPQ